MNPKNKSIKVEESNMKIIDLSHSVTPDMPVYPGTEAPVFNESHSIKEQGFRERMITMVSHTGTHMDAPAHILPEGKTLDQMPIDHFGGKGVVLDMHATERSQIHIDELKPFASLIEKGDFILIRTDWSRFWGKKEYFTGYPVLTPQAAQWLCGFNLKGIGVDMISFDGVGYEFPVHRIFLGNDLVLVENLTNLSSLPESGFLFFCLPLKMEDSDGSPVRAAAVIPSP